VATVFEVRDEIRELGRVPCHWHWVRYAHCRQGRPPWLARV